MYCERLTNLFTAIQEKRPILEKQNGVIFYHDTTRPHDAKQTLQKRK